MASGPSLRRVVLPVRRLGLPGQAPRTVVLALPAGARRGGVTVQVRLVARLGGRTVVVRRTLHSGR